MPATDSTTLPVLVVGATGSLGSKVVDELLGRGKNANDIDTIGNANLAEAAHRIGIRRFVLTSILTSDQTPQVLHFWHKKLAEDKLEQLGVPFVALRPGGVCQENGVTDLC
jgi:uncharacterized protein YbjT (DUF2867 family)